MSGRTLIFTLCSSTLLIAAAFFSLPVKGQMGPPAPPPPRLGAPLPGLTPAERGLFDAGLDDFLEVEVEADGLGPSFNGASCAICHNLPAVGGTGNSSVLRAGTLQNGAFTPPPGGDLIHLFSIPDHRCQPTVPGNANVLARRIPTPLFGAGLVEAIPDAAILANEDPNDRNGDGIRGQAHTVFDVATRVRRVGRYGWKSQQATLLAFAGDAYLNEMGITNDLFPNEYASGIAPDQLSNCDTVPDPEDKRDPVTNRRGIDNFENFMKFLAPAPRGPMTDAARRGAELFTSIGCASCHTPLFMTGPNPIPALDLKPVAAFSDFLLHDIGTGDGIQQGDASPGQFRSAPLWGLRHRKILMHDGRSIAVPDAIRQHRREADASRRRFDAMPPMDQRALLDFLSTI